MAKSWVPRGGEYRMVLADGTRVMLNAETRLRFPEAFGDGERRVFLEGEAYFEVAKERERPFWVDFREGTVRVLGTQFNVKAYGERKLWLPWFMGRWKWPGARRLLCYNPVSNAGSLPVNRMR